MARFPSFREQPYYAALRNWLSVVLNEDGTLKDEAVESAVNAVVPGEVTAQLAADSTVRDAAAAAIDNEIVGRDILEGTDPRVPKEQGTAEDIAYARIFADGKRTAHELDFDGRPTPWAARLIDEAVRARHTQEVGDNIAYARVFADGKRSFLEFDFDGRPTPWAAQLIAEAIELPPGPAPDPEPATLTFTDGRVAAASRLRRFHTALAGADVAPVDIVFLGDSVTEGANAQSRDSRWSALAFERIRQEFQPAGIAGGAGYVPIQYLVGTVPDAWTTTGSVTMKAFDGAGMGGKTHEFADGATASLTIAATSFRILYAKQPTHGSFTVAIDGGPPVAITANDVAALRDGFVWDSPALSPGTHTITLISSGTTWIHGAMVFNGDEAAGVRFWDGGRSGQQTSSLVGTDALKLTFDQFGASVTADLVVIGLGLNDYSAGRAPGQYGAFLREIITEVRAHNGPAPSFVLIAPYQRLDVPTPAYPMTDYVDQIYAIAAEDGDVFVFDAYARMRDGGTEYGLFDGLDLVHLTPIVGSRWFARQFSSAIIP